MRMDWRGRVYRIRFDAVGAAARDCSIGENCGLGRQRFGRRARQNESWWVWRRGFPPLRRKDVARMGHPGFVLGWTTGMQILPLRCTQGQEVLRLRLRMTKLRVV